VSGVQVPFPLLKLLNKKRKFIDSYQFFLLKLSNFDFDLSVCLNEASFLKIFKRRFEILNLFKHRFDENEPSNNEIKNGEGHIS